jgi:hypothetical protein
MVSVRYSFNKVRQETIILVTTSCRRPTGIGQTPDGDCLRTNTAYLSENIFYTWSKLLPLVCNTTVLNNLNDNGWLKWQLSANLSY